MKRPRLGKYDFMRLSTPVWDSGAGQTSGLPSAHSVILNILARGSVLLSVSTLLRTYTVFPNMVVISHM